MKLHLFGLTIVIKKGKTSTQKDDAQLKSVEPQVKKRTRKKSESFRLFGKQLKDLTPAERKIYGQHIRNKKKVDQAKRIIKNVEVKGTPAPTKRTDAITISEQSRRFREKIESDLKPVKTKSKSHVEGGKSMWAKYTPEQKAEHLRKLKEGRERAKLAKSAKEKGWKVKNGK